MEYYSAIKNNKVMISATTCMNLENIMQSERSQTQKDMYYMNHSHKIYRIDIKP